MDIAGLSAAYLAEYRRNHGQRTVEIWVFWLETFARFCQDYGLGTTLEAWHLAGFRQQLESRPGPKGRLYAAHTVYQGMRAVVAFTRWLAAHGHLAEDPTDGVLGLPPPRRVMPVLSPPQVLALLAAAPPTGPVGLRDRALLETYVGTALPLMATSELQLEHLDLAQAVLHITGRPVRLGRRLVEVLGLYLAQARPCLVYRPQERRLFVGEKGGRLVAAVISKTIQRYADQAGLNRPVTAGTLSRSGPGLGPKFHDGPFEPTITRGLPA